MLATHGISNPKLASQNPQVSPAPDTPRTATDSIPRRDFFHQAKPPRNKNSPQETLCLLNHKVLSCANIRRNPLPAPAVVRTAEKLAAILAT